MCQWIPIICILISESRFKVFLFTFRHFETTSIILINISSIIFLYQFFYFCGKFVFIISKLTQYSITPSFNSKAQTQRLVIFFAIFNAPLFSKKSLCIFIEQPAIVSSWFNLNLGCRSFGLRFFFLLYFYILLH